MMNEKQMQNNLTEQVKGLLTADETAELLHLPKSWLYERSRHDALERLGMRRCGKYIRFSEEAVTEFIERGGDLD